MNHMQDEIHVDYYVEPSNDHFLLLVLVYVDVN